MKEKHNIDILINNHNPEEKNRQYKEGEYH